MKAHIAFFCLAALSLVSIGAFAQDLSATEITALVKTEIAKTRDSKAPATRTCIFAVCVAESGQAPVVIVGRPIAVKAGTGEIDYRDERAAMVFRGKASPTDDKRRLLQGDFAIILPTPLPRNSDVPPPTIKLHVNIALPPGTLTQLSSMTGSTVNPSTGKSGQHSTYLFCQND